MSKGQAMGLGMLLFAIVVSLITDAPNVAPWWMPLLLATIGLFILAIEEGS